MSKSEKDIISEELAHLADSGKLKRDIYRSDLEKLQLFTKMLRTNKLLKRAVIRHK
ncbi:MAG: hypothetical protein JST32_21110 [Bacteroidetes bacterium]|nr:hypothetical protein [Bacteroidota bacterium]